MTDKAVIPNRWITIWLVMCLLMVALMVIVGGLTRLTESGLSIVEWKPISGTLPPLDDAAWQEAFQKYQQTPEYQHVNKGMSLAEFKNIFWLEYLHRLLGRLIGLVWFLPLAFFYVTHQLPKSSALRLLGIFLLGGVQGAVGWYMVKSGLADDPRVSPYRLALHLALAFLIFALILRTLLGMIWPHTPPVQAVPRCVKTGANILLVLVFLQIVLGALVAGNDAGLIYNTFPLMDGRWIPAELSAFPITVRSFFEQVTLVQFNHRIGAYIVTLYMFFYWFYAFRYATQPTMLRAAFYLLPAIVMAQVVLGIKTLVLGVPIGLASAHQGLALILFAAAITIHFGLHRRYYSLHAD